MNWTDLDRTPSCKASSNERTPRNDLSDHQKEFKERLTSAEGALVEYAYRTRDGIANVLDLFDLFQYAKAFVRMEDSMKKFYDSLTVAERKRANLPTTWDLTKPDWKAMYDFYGVAARWFFLNAVKNMPEPGKLPSIVSLHRMWNGLAPLPEHPIVID